MPTTYTTDYLSADVRAAVAVTATGVRVLRRQDSTEAHAYRTSKFIAVVVDLPQFGGERTESIELLVTLDGDTASWVWPYWFQTDERRAVVTAV
jgi:hypothetical protein